MEMYQTGIWWYKIWIDESVHVTIIKIKSYVTEKTVYIYLRHEIC